MHASLSQPVPKLAASHSVTVFENFGGLAGAEAGQDALTPSFTKAPASCTHRPGCPVDFAIGAPLQTPPNCQTWLQLPAPTGSNAPHVQAPQPVSTAPSPMATELGV